MSAAGIIAAAATGVVTSEMLERFKETDERIVTLLENTLAGIRVIQQFNERQRTVTPTIIEMACSYAAGVATNPPSSVFTPQAPFAVEKIILTGLSTNSQPMVAALSIGTRRILLPIPSQTDTAIATSRNVGVQEYNLPYYWNSQIDMADTTPTYTPTFDCLIFIVGRYDTQGTLDKQHANGAYR